MLTFLPVALRGEQGAVAEADVARLQAPVSGRALERVRLSAGALCGCGRAISRTHVHDLVQTRRGLNIVLSHTKSDVLALATNRTTLWLRVSMVPPGGVLPPTPPGKQARIKK